MSEDKQVLSLLITENQTQLIINGNLEFNIEERDDIKKIHLADVLYATVNDKLRKQAKAVLAPGMYRMALTVALTTMEDGTVQEDDEPTITAEESSALGL